MVATAPAVVPAYIKLLVGHALDCLPIAARLPDAYPNANANSDVPIDPLHAP